MSFQPLTKEQYQKALKSGFSHMQILENEKKRKESESPGFFSRVKSQVKGNIKEASQSLDASGETMNPFSAGANIAKNVSGALLSPISQALQPIAEKTLAPVTNAIVGTKPVQKAIDWASQKPELAGAIGDTIETGINMVGVKGSASLLQGGINKAVRATQNMSLSDGSTSAGIMDRIVRLKPTDATKFKNITGKTPGQYLSESKNFGPPDKIITNEASKFAQSKGAVDAELAKLPGVYKNGAVSDALKGLYEKGLKVSSPNVKAPYMDQLVGWINKYKSGGLTMDEINAVKRLYEREVKLGYNKLMNGDKVQQATNIDNALRKWQVEQANELGFKNIAELNKQTQISKFIVNKLGDKVVGQKALNSVNLTDWIVLGGGDPVSVAGFLTKKFFSSAWVQARIAKLLSHGKGPGPIKADVGPTQVKNLSAPTSNYRSQQGSGKPIKMAPKDGRYEIIDQ